jgi:hypothetical protein
MPYLFVYKTTVLWTLTLLKQNWEHSLRRFSVRMLPNTLS